MTEREHLAQEAANLRADVKWVCLIILAVVIVGHAVFVGFCFAVIKLVELFHA